MIKEIIFSKKILSSFILGTKEEVAELLLSNIINKESSKVILPCSLNDLAQLDRQPSLRKIYQQVDYFTTDSIFLTWWFRVKNKHMAIERVYGPDLLILLLDQLKTQKLSVAYLCSNKQTVSSIRKVVSSYGHCSTFYVLPIYSSQKNEDALLKAIVQQKPNLIVLGIGSPKQVELAVKIKSKTKSSLIFCAGAALEFLAGTKKQAPKWMQNNGLEWLFRLIIEPKRLGKRYLIDIPLFLINSLLRKLRLYPFK